MWFKASTSKSTKSSRKEWKSDKKLTNASKKMLPTKEGPAMSSPIILLILKLSRGKKADSTATHCRTIRAGNPVLLKLRVLIGTLQAYQITWSLWINKRTSVNLIRMHNNNIKANRIIYFFLSKQLWDSKREHIHQKHLLVNWMDNKLVTMMKLARKQATRRTLMEML